ncbi:MAG: hypothetical protein K9I68_00130 [Bacteroidales bacterium]|nr:hypothetical protein [Bacteroidales bacterium]MCF8337945.1 hypothetical protein [Bacteroidales bacterium]
MEQKNLNLEPYKQQAEIVEKTAHQVIKDFNTFGIQIFFSGFSEWAYDELFDQLEQNISEMLSSYPEKLWALLYHIDVDKNRIDRESLNYSDWSYAEVITELILYRELKKVVTREYIKRNPDWLKE